MASSPSSPEISHTTGIETHAGFSYKDATEEEIMEDLTSRFILNLPDEELTSLERICFQVEQAHWFYEDFIREENRRCHSLPLKRFTAMMFAACPILQQWNHEEAFQKFMEYKTLVPVCGAIMLNEKWDKCVLVKGWKSSSGWGFPKGKINETEPEAVCAAREVLEETGYNLAGKINPEHYIETINNGQRVTLFIVPGVSEKFEFATKTRKEISRIEWFNLADLPGWRRNKHASGKFYLIAPFINPLKTFINTNKPRKSGRKAPPTPKVQPSPPHQVDAPTDSDTLHDSSSQSSSLDNGGPQTPSPQYTESSPAFVPAIAGQDVPVSTESLDPHFARLLSGLTLSSGPPLEDEKTAKSVPESTSLLQTIFNSVAPSANGEETTSSKPAPPPTQLSPPPAVHSPTESVDTVNNTTTSATQLAAAARRPMSVSPALPTPSAPIPIAPGSNTFNPGQLTVSNASISPSISPRSPTFRKSTADISPYLARPMATEVPVSAKRLQQLALLESVANESARMTPKLRDHAPYAPGGASVFPPLPEGRFVPLYPQAPRDVRPMPPPYANPQYSPQSSDPFILRARTSQAMHRTGFHAPGSSSMNHNQLLSMINGTQRTGVGPLPPGPPPFPPVSFNPGAPYPFGGPPQHPMNTMGPGGMSPLYPRQYDAYSQPQVPIPGPRPFTTVQNGPPNPSAGTLLSILNSSLPPTADPQFTRA